jgi:hypothetical protein
MPASSANRSMRPGFRPASTRSMSASRACRCPRRCACDYIPVTSRRELLRLRHRGLPRRRLCRGLRRGDIALALGVEKLKDTGYGGLPGLNAGSTPPLWWSNLTAPGSFAQLASAYRAKHGVSRDDLKRAMAHVSVKSHDNGAEESQGPPAARDHRGDVLNAPLIADPLGLYDCCGVSDGAAAAIVTTPRDRAQPRKEGHRLGQGTPDRGLQRDRGAAQHLGRKLLRHRPRRCAARLPRGRHRPSARAA